MTTAYTLPLADVQATLATAGGKGASLARLARAGLPVPDGFYVTTAAYQQFVAANDLPAGILAALASVDASRPATLEAASRALYDLFARAAMPPDIADAIACAYQALPSPHPARIGGAPVAVRSSATAEDLPELSFAGQQETFLNVCGAPAVVDAVKRCWASLWTARAIGYRAQHGIKHISVSLAVVVQQLVPADAAGIMFTANPTSGQRGEVVIAAAWGLGEAIVSGAVTPDTLTVDKATGSIRRETAVKLVMTARTEAGTCEQPVPEHMRRKPVLDDAQAAELVQLGLRIEALYGMPMDIEWALTEDAGTGRPTFAILQARPITALPAEPPPEQTLEWPLPHPKAMLARGSFAEFVPEPVSPLFATLALPLARKATLALMAGFLGPKRADCYLFAVVNGYVYVGLVFTPMNTLAFTKATIAMSRQLLATGKARAAAARESGLAVVQRWQARELSALSPSELLAGAREIFAATAEYYTVAQSGTIPAASISEIAFAKFYDALVRRTGEPEAATFLFGAESQPLRAEKSLFDLAMWLNQQPALAEQVVQQPADEVCRALAAPADGAAWDALRSRFAAHLAAYGHVIYDLDFAKPVPADDPAPLVAAIKVYLAGGGSNPHQRQQAALEQRERASAAVAGRLGALRRRWFLKLLARAQAAAPLREDSIADLGLGYPELRRLLGEFGRRLTSGGALVSAGDIYWLEAHEADQLAAALEHGEQLPSYANRVAARKAEWQAMRRITPPATLPKQSWMARFMPSEEQRGDTIKGLGSSAGKVRARACVLHGPEDFDQLRPGDVIVAVTTTPAWTPLFALAAAVVTDIGGPLSHSSIVAREYGIPAVLGVGVATRRIHSGQMITVDGGAGVITLV